MKYFVFELSLQKIFLISFMDVKTNVKKKLKIQILLK